MSVRIHETAMNAWSNALGSYLCLRAGRRDGRQHAKQHLAVMARHPTREPLSGNKGRRMSPKHHLASVFHAAQILASTVHTPTPSIRKLMPCMQCTLIPHAYHLYRWNVSTIKLLHTSPSSRTLPGSDGVLHHEPRENVHADKLLDEEFCGIRHCDLHNSL